MYSIILLSLLSFIQGPVSTANVQEPSSALTKTIILDGITTKWTPVGNFMEFEVTANTIGWVSIGFNDRDASVFSNRIVGGVGNGFAKVEENYMVRSTLQKSIESAGGKTAISDANVMEENGKTVMRFKIPKVSQDIYHYDLLPGQKIWITCAFSENDDFNFLTKAERRVEITL